MKRTRLIFVVAMMLLTVSVNAQFGGLKGLKDKVKKEAKSTAGNKAENAAATASLNDEQKWALNQLKTLSEAPALPNLMKPSSDARIPAPTNFDPPKIIKDVAQGLYVPTREQVKNTRALMDKRVAYTMRVKKAIESLPNGLLPLDQDYKLRNRLDTLEYQLLLFHSLQQKVSDEMGMRFFDMNAKRDGSGKMVIRDGGMIWPIPGGKTYFPVTKDKKDGKYKFYDNEKRAFTKIGADGIKDQEKFLLSLENGYTFLEQNDVTLDMYQRQNTDPSNYLDCLDKCKLAQQAVKEALENNK